VDATSPVRGVPLSGRAGGTGLGVPSATSSGMEALLASFKGVMLLCGTFPASRQANSHRVRKRARNLAAVPILHAFSTALVNTHWQHLCRHKGRGCTCGTYSPAAATLGYIWTMRCMHLTRLSPYTVDGAAHAVILVVLESNTWDWTTCNGQHVQHTQDSPGWLNSETGGCCIGWQQE
jgi:hypothetical protein